MPRYPSVVTDTCFVLKMIVWDSNVQPLIAFNESCISLLVFVARNTKNECNNEQAVLLCITCCNAIASWARRSIFCSSMYISMSLSAAVFLSLLSTSSMALPFLFATTRKCHNVIIRHSRTTAPLSPYGQYHAHLPHLATSHQETQSFNTWISAPWSLASTSGEQRGVSLLVKRLIIIFCFSVDWGKRKTRWGIKNKAVKQRNNQPATSGNQPAMVHRHPKWRCVNVERLIVVVFLFFLCQHPCASIIPWLLLFFVFPQGWLLKVVDCCFYFFLNQPATTYAMKAHRKVDCCCFFVFPLSASLSIDRPWLLVVFYFLTLSKVVFVFFFFQPATTYAMKAHRSSKGWLLFFCFSSSASTVLDCWFFSHSKVNCRRLIVDVFVFPLNKHARTYSMKARRSLKGWLLFCFVFFVSWHPCTKVDCRRLMHGG